MASSITNGDHTNGYTRTSAKITLYTNHRCPYAHRAHIALQELDLPFEEIIIDIDSPRPQWYLDINPRGLVPSIKISIPGQFEDEIVYESSIVARFLCDAFPSHLLPHDPLRRARMNFFIDAWEARFQPGVIAAVRANTQEERDAKIEESVAFTKTGIEPLLSDAAPFFGGSERLTLVEVMTAPQLLRFYSLSKAGDMLPTSLAEKLDALPNFSKWAKAVMADKSVNKIYQGYVTKTCRDFKKE